MNILVVGASRGLGRAFVEGLGAAGDRIVGVSRRRPDAVRNAGGATVAWIVADLADPVQAVGRIEREAPENIDVLICNLGIWEHAAFSEDYAFLDDRDDEILQMLTVNVGATVLLLKRLLPRMLGGRKPQVILTGSTSALPHCGRPEVTFGATKSALNGIADALREGFRARRLAVSCLQLGYLNTDDGLDSSLSRAVERGGDRKIPVHDVVALVRAMMALSDASFVREVVLPALLDERF